MYYPRYIKSLNSTYLIDLPWIIPWNNYNGIPWIVPWPSIVPWYLESFKSTYLELYLDIPWYLHLDRRNCFHQSPLSNDLLRNTLIILTHHLIYLSGLIPWNASNFCLFSKTSFPSRYPCRKPRISTSSPTNCAVWAKTKLEPSSRRKWTPTRKPSKTKWAKFGPCSRPKGRSTATWKSLRALLSRHCNRNIPDSDIDDKVIQNRDRLILNIVYFLILQ